MTSAYPMPVDELTERVRERAAQLRGWPSRNQIKKEFRVGGPKATAALDALRAAGFNPADPDRAAAGPALRAVPDLAEDPDTGRPDVDSTADPTAAAAAAATPVPSGEAARDASGPAGRDASGPAVDDESRRDAETGAGQALTPDQAADDQPGDRSVQMVGDADPGTGTRAVRISRWPLLLIAGAAFVAIWGGWVGLGELTGFGPIRLLPGIWDGFVINSAITLPIGMEAYAAYALRAWLSPPEAGLSRTARRFAGWSAIGALVLGALAQVAYHLMVAAGMTRAPWQITAAVSCLPVLVLALAAALTHLIHHSEATR